MLHMAVKRDKLIQTVAGSIARHGLIAPGDHLLVAVSGGADSVALAAILVELGGGRRSGFDLTLAHLDHALRPTSQQDAESVGRLAGQWDVPLVSERIDVGWLARQRKVGIEEAARIARYDFLHRVARQVGARRIALGHHRDDQAETVLMNVLRGGDIRGLAGMPVRRPIARGSDVEIIRPLLDVTRDELRRFLHRRQLDWVEDETNLSSEPLRNRIRLQLLPLLERDYASGVSRRMAALAQRMAVLAEQLQQRAEQLWPQVVVRRDGRKIELNRACLIEAGQPLAVRLVCMAVEELGHGLGSVTAEHMDAAWSVVASARGGRRICLPGNIQLRRAGQAIILEPATEESA